MTNPIDAAFRRTGQGCEFDLSRPIGQSVEKVWAALTTPERIAHWMGVEWLGEAGPLKAGAAFDYRFGDTGMESRGRVLTFDPPRVFEHSWFENFSPGQVVRWELAPEGDGCRLTLTHRFGAPDDAPRTAAGWTVLLDGLVAGLAGEGPHAGDGKQSWRRMRDHYATVFPPEATRDGRRVEVGGSPALRFERRLAGPPEKIWAALVEPKGLARWMQADARVEPHLGGRFRLGLDYGRVAMEGTITAWAPPSLLEYSWTETEANGDSLVRFELYPEPDGCRLVLTHILKAGGDLVGFAEGWHWHLDALDRALEGETIEIDRPRLEALRRIYAATL